MRLSDWFVPPIWVTCPDEGLRIRIAIEPELSGTVTDGEQLPTLIRFQKFGTSLANGDYIEAVAAVSTQGGLIIGIHRKLYVTWIAPALDPALNFSRYFTTILALPVTMASPPSHYPAAVNLLQTQRFSNPSDLQLDTH